MSNTDPSKALIKLAEFYKWEGDLIRCRACDRAQHVLWYATMFPHPSECRFIDAPKSPWLVIRVVLDKIRETALDNTEEVKPC